MVGSSQDYCAPLLLQTWLRLYYLKNKNGNRGALSLQPRCCVSLPRWACTVVWASLKRSICLYEKSGAFVLPGKTGTKVEVRYHGEYDNLVLLSSAQVGLRPTQPYGGKGHCMINYKLRPLQIGIKVPCACKLL